MGYDVVALALQDEYDLQRQDSWSLRDCDGTFSDQSSIFAILDQLHPFVPNYILYHDDSFPALRVRDLEKVGIPTLYYAVDVHIHWSWQRYVSTAFDHTFIAQKNYLPAFQELTSQVSWLPLWAPQLITPHPHKDIPICFRGTLTLPQRQQRVSFLEEVARAVPLDFAAGDFKDAFSRASIVLNEQIADDVNFRVFEAIMCGACLVTPDSGNGLRDLFTPDEHLVVYEPHSPHDAIAKLRALIEDPARCAAIAQAGRDHLLAHHCARHRAATISDVMRSLLTGPRPLAPQVALHDALRWWGMKVGDYRQLSSAWWEYLFQRLDEIATNPTPLTQETILSLVELVDAVESDSPSPSDSSAGGRSITARLLDESSIETPAARLSTIVSHLARRSEPFAGAVAIMQLYLEYRRGLHSADAARSIIELYSSLKSSSTFRVFDRRR